MRCGRGAPSRETLAAKGCSALPGRLRRPVRARRPALRLRACVSRPASAGLQTRSGRGAARNVRRYMSRRDGARDLAARDVARSGPAPPTRAGTEARAPTQNACFASGGARVSRPARGAERPATALHVAARRLARPRGEDVARSGRLRRPVRVWRPALRQRWRPRALPAGRGRTALHVAARRLARSRSATDVARSGPAPPTRAGTEARAPTQSACRASGGARVSRPARGAERPATRATCRGATSREISQQGM